MERMEGLRGMNELIIGDRIREEGGTIEGEVRGSHVSGGPTFHTFSKYVYVTTDHLLHLIRSFNHLRNNRTSYPTNPRSGFKIYLAQSWFSVSDHYIFLVVLGYEKVWKIYESN